MHNERRMSVGVIVGPLPVGSRASAGHLPTGNNAQVGATIEEMDHTNP